ncbi:MAG: NF038122 family metalloprotease [Rhodopila sp.]
MQINFVYDPSTASAPAGFFTALNYVARVLDALIINPITVNIEVGWNEIAGSPLPSGDLATGGDSHGNDLTYSQLVAELSAHAGNPADQQELASLPANAASQLPAQLFVSTAQEKAWGLLAPNADVIDGAVGFSSAYTYSFNVNDQNVPGESGFVAVAEHEITHALARLPDNGAFALTDYSAPGVLNTSGGGGYYSVDGGVTDLGNFAPAAQDPADWAAHNGDAFDAQGTEGDGGVLTEVDKTLLGTLGFSEANTQFLAANATTGQSELENGIPYSGPLAGITQDVIIASSDNIDITAYAPNSLIDVGGNGMDAINVGPAGGNNVIEVAAGSDFLIGGTGDDTFSLDDRSPAGNTWSSILNFHSGDAAVLWGVTIADFSVAWLNGQGAPGATGLTGVFTAPGKDSVAITLSGHTTADLTDGKLSIAYGTTPNEPGSPGTPYTYITAA